MLSRNPMWFRSIWQTKRSLDPQKISPTRIRSTRHGAHVGMANVSCSDWGNRGNLDESKGEICSGRKWLQKTWLENKLLLISISFTPKTSHSFLELWYTMFCRMLKIQPGLKNKNTNTTYSRCFPLTNFSVQSFKHWISLVVKHFEALPCLGFKMSILLDHH